MARYSELAYASLHKGIKVLQADLKTEQGQKVLHRELAKAQVLITSFRPSALTRLNLSWKQLHQQYPALSQIAIVGSPGTGAEEAGHDLTYQAQAGLITDLALPPTLYADMGGALLASEAVLQAVLAQKTKGKGVRLEVALSEAAHWAALPRTWGLIHGQTALGGAHAGYQVYACLDGRLALAALEPHFARRLAQVVGLPLKADHDAEVMASMLNPATRKHLQGYFKRMTRSQLEALAAERDIPMHTMGPTTALASNLRGKKAG